MSSTLLRTGLVAFTGLALALGTAACSPTSTVNTSAANGSSSAAKSAGGSAGKAGSGSAGKSGSHTAAVGDTLHLSGMSTDADVTVLKVVSKARPTDEFSQPESGKRFYAVQFRIKDTGTGAYDDSPGNGAEVVDSAGQHYQADINDTKAGPSLPAELKIAPGDSAVGFLTFQVPVGARITKIQFSLDSGFADQTGQWKVA